MAKKSGKTAAVAAGEPVRMLVDRVVDGITYLCNQVVVFPDHIKAELVANGAADAAREALEYCITELAAEVIEHVADAIEQAINEPAENPATAEQGE